MTSHNGPTSQPYQFVGQLGYYTHYQEPNLGLMQLGVRFYDPEVGRFTQRDPLSFLLNVIPYAYADCNPKNGVDPDGRFHRLTIPKPIKWICKFIPDWWLCKKIVKPANNVCKIKEGFDCAKCAGDLLDAGNECRHHANDHLDEILAPPYYGNRLKWQIDCVNKVVREHGHDTSLVECLTKCAKIPIEWLGGITPERM